MFAVEKPFKENMMNAQKILKNEVLLNLAGNEYVAMAFMKLCATYKYISIFI